MTTAVLDANVLAAQVLALPYSDAAVRIARHYDAVTVEQSIPEVATAIIKAVRAGLLAEEDAEPALQSVTRLARTFSMVGMEREALRLALRLGHSAYDCFYMRLAEQLGIPFASADRKFLRKAKDVATVPLLDLFDLPENLP